MNPLTIKRRIPALVLIALILSGCGGSGPLPPSDTTAPTVSSVSPINGAQNVSVNSSIMITFSEAMDASSINAQTITLSTESGNVEGTVTYSGTTAVFKPSSSLNSLTWYSVTVDGSVRDAAGNAMGGPIGYSFKTGTTPDTTPPAVIPSGTIPAQGATGVVVNGKISVTFSEPIDPQTISFTLSTGNATVPCSFTPSGTIAIFTPSNDLSYNTEYTAKVNAGVKDLAGNIMAVDYIWTFTTGAKPDTDSPKVSDVQPPKGKTGVSIPTVISITFNEPMDAATLTTATIKVSTLAGDIPGTVIVTGGGTTATFEPIGSLSHNTVYIVTVTTGVKDLAGNAMADAFVSSFMTGTASDVTSPYIVTGSNLPVGNGVAVHSPISVTFSEQMNVSTITPDNFVLRQGSETITGVIAYYGTTAILTPSSPLQYSTDYTVTIAKAVMDLAGNQMSSDFTWTFRTGPQAPDIVSPDVLSTFPDHTQSGVPVYKQIVASFSETMLASTINSTTFILKDASGTGISGQVTSSGATAIFTPAAPLAYNTVYTVVITSGATDLAGNPLNGNSTGGYTWNFTTETVPAYTLTASAGTGGSISPSGAVPMVYGGNQTFTITPNANYHIVDVQVDGSSIGPMASYTFTNVMANHTISASFAIDTHSVTASAGANGSISLSGTITVNHGASQAFTVTPDTGYHAVMGGTCGGTLSGNIYTTAAITGDCTVQANFAINTYTVTPSVIAGNGSISPNTPQTVDHNATQSFTLTPAAGYHIVTVSGTCGGSLTGDTYVTAAVTADCTVQASFAINTYTITASAGAGGSISSAGTVTVDYGANQMYTITPTTGYHLADVLVDGTSVGAVTSYTFTNVTTDHTISASFAIDTFTITASAGAGGGISPAGTVTVDYGANQTYTIAPGSGYYISDVTVDGISAGLVSSYTFTYITTNHTIAASFAPITHIITASVVTEGTGTIDPYGQVLVNDGATKSFVLTPATGYHLVTPVGGTCGGTLAGDGITYTTGAVSGDCTIIADFAINTYTITPSVVGGNGTISPDTGQTVNYDGTTTFTLNPGTGYHAVMSGTCGGTLSGDGLSYTTAAITANCTVVASFDINTYTVTPSVPGGNGTIDPATAQVVNYNGTVSFILSPATGYHIDIVGGSCGGTLDVNTYTTAAVTNDCSVIASFVINTYTITTTPGAGGAITPLNPTVNYGDSPTFTISPDTGYIIEDVLVDGVSQGAVTSYTFNNVTADHTISATFTAT